MTRKHYEALAKIVKGIYDPDTRATVANQIAFMCASDNPLFDDSRFFNACNVQPFATPGVSDATR